MPPPIKRAKKSNVGPWEQAPDTVQERLEANLAAEGMEDILEEVSFPFLFKFHDDY